MNIYCVHDRMIGYWLTPLAAQDDAAMKHSLSQVVNSEASQHAITQAPHHYDLYRLGKVEEDGHITPDRQYVCCAQDLIRPRTPGPDYARRHRPGNPPMAGTTPESNRPPGSPPSNATIGQRPKGDENRLEATDVALSAGREGLQGSTGLRD